MARTRQTLRVASLAPAGLIRGLPLCGLRGNNLGFVAVEDFTHARFVEEARLPIFILKLGFLGSNTEQYPAFVYQCILMGITFVAPGALFQYTRGMPGLS